MFQIAQAKQKTKSELSKQSRAYEERMLTLMKQLPPVGIKESAEYKVMFSAVRLSRSQFTHFKILDK